MPCGGPPQLSPPHEECFAWSGPDAGADADAGTGGGGGGAPAVCPSKGDAEQIFDLDNIDQATVQSAGTRKGDQCCYTVVRQEFIGC